MGKGKHTKTPAQKAVQKQRTRQNKIRKYEKLLKNFPNSKDVKIWQKKLNELEN